MWARVPWWISKKRPFNIIINLFKVDFKYHPSNFFQCNTQFSSIRAQFVPAQGCLLLEKTSLAQKRLGTRRLLISCGLLQDSWELRTLRDCLLVDVQMLLSSRPRYGRWDSNWRYSLGFLNGTVQQRNQSGSRVSALNRYVIIMAVRSHLN